MFHFLTTPLSYVPHLKLVKPLMLNRPLIPMVLTSFRLRSTLIGLLLRLLRLGYLRRLNVSSNYSIFVITWLCGKLFEAM
jgi:hypothetical protein